jgi:hypothetical protein
MQPLSSDLQEFIHLLNTKSVKYVIVGAWVLAFHAATLFRDLDIFVARGDENTDKLLAVIGAFGFGHAGIKREISCRSITSFNLGASPISSISLPESVECHSTKHGRTESRGRLPIPLYLSLAEIF